MEQEQLPDPLGSLDLDDRQIESLAYLIASPAYVEVFAPIMAGLERSMIESLIDPAKERKWSKNDNYLRGGIIVLRALQNLPRSIVGDARQRQVEDDRVQTVEQRYVDRANAGAVGPLGFNYDPAEDF
jgi:hypothetical protein